MPAAILYGAYTPAGWAAIRSDAGTAPQAIGDAAAAAGFRLAGFWFAFDENDFYAIVEGDDMLKLAAMRHALMAGGRFKALFADPCFPPDEMLPALHAAGDAGGDGAGG